MLKRGNKSNTSSGNHENGSLTPSARGAATAASGQSMSTSGSMGSPMATPNRDTTFARLNDLDIQGEDAAPAQGTAGRKKRGGQRATGGDKSARGLRQFSMKVCEKVESKGRTTYNEVADELVAEFQDTTSTLAAPDQPQYDEKNIRRRVYDALNVLMAMDIISKDKKEIQWKGLPQSNAEDTEGLKSERLRIRNQIDKKTAYLNELEEQYIGLQTLIQRNEQLYCSGNLPSGGVALPFILVQTRPHATVEVEISEDMQLVHFDFNSTPFELHDDNYVLKAMNLCHKPLSHGVAQQHVAMNGDESSSTPNMSHPQVSLPTRSNNSGRPPASPHVPGILKGRVKHEH